jgi:ketosteroid isomerase-like protein
MTMRRIALAIAFVIGLVAPTLAQKAEIEAANAKWIELFNKGDFAGIAATPQEVVGKYVVVWEKVGDDWKLAADIWNDGK